VTVCRKNRATSGLTISRGRRIMANEIIPNDVMAKLFWGIVEERMREPRRV